MHSSKKETPCLSLANFEMTTVDYTDQKIYHPIFIDPEARDADVVDRLLIKKIKPSFFFGECTFTHRNCHGSMQIYALQ